MNVLRAPVDPSPDHARELLRRELLHSEYHHQNPVQALLDRLQHAVDSALRAASAASPVATLGGVVVFLVLLLAAAWLLSRASGSPRTPVRDAAVLTGDPVTAADLRARAETALAEDRFAEAVLDGFRALATRQVERGRIDDAPGATAQEVASSLAAAYPDRSDVVRESCLLFDLVRYGDRPATQGQAGTVLALDDELAARR